MGSEPLAARRPAPPADPAGCPQGPLRMALTGSRGLLGSALVPFLTAGGHRVIRLVRGTATGLDEIGWSPEAGCAEPSRMEGLDAGVHLAGENIAAGRRRPALPPLPAFTARLALGEMADALLLASTRAVPTRLLATGYRFRHPDLAGALRHLLGRGSR